jgi:hypothetical protein
MSELAPIRCKNCGGAVSSRVGGLPACVFCGSDASYLIPFEPEEGLEAPQGVIPFQVDLRGARDAFDQFADSSIWYPADLNDVNVRLNRVLIPAWMWAGEVETHWTGLVRAQTQSGKRPVSGAETMGFDQVLVPASTTLSLAELAQLGRFQEDRLVDFDDHAMEDAYELMEMTRSVARQTAQGVMRLRHRGQIVSREQTTELNTATVCVKLSGRPVLIPVYIGAYRYKDTLYRLLIHGQTGALVGRAPVSWVKVTLAVAGGLLASALAAVCSGVLVWLSV